MTDIPGIINDLKSFRLALLDSIDALSQRELTQTPIYNDTWTIKDLFSHLLGWDQRVIAILPLIVQDQANKVAGVDVQSHNKQLVAACKDMSFIEVVAQTHATHQQILDFLTSIDFEEIDRRHERNGRIITIRSYIIDSMMGYAHRHTVEIEQWRKNLDRQVDPAAIKANLAQSRLNFMSVLDQFNEADALNRTAVGTWSVSDVTGHIADWELRMLKAAQHIHDPSRPALRPVNKSTLEWNEIMAARRKEKGWAENYQDLRKAQSDIDNFVTTLKPGDWTLRGNYPWPDDQGTLAELMLHVTEHYSNHQPAVELWANR